MYVCTYVCTYVSVSHYISVRMNACMYVCMYVRMHVFVITYLYVCMHGCIWHVCAQCEVKLFAFELAGRRPQAKRNSRFEKPFENRHGTKFDFWNGCERDFRFASV